MQLFDDFLTRISALGAKLLIASGNHDSPERLAFGGRLMSNSGVYIAGAFDGNPAKITLCDKYGEVDFWLLPFIKPAAIRRFFPEAEIADTNDVIIYARQDQTDFSEACADEWQEDSNYE